MYWVRSRAGNPRTSVYCLIDTATAPTETSMYFCRFASTSFKSVPFPPPPNQPPFLLHSSYCLTVVPMELNIIFNPVSSTFLLPVPNAALANPPTTPPIAAPSGPPTIAPIAVPAPTVNQDEPPPIPLPSLIKFPSPRPAPIPPAYEARVPIAVADSASVTPTP